MRSRALLPIALILALCFPLAASADTASTRAQLEQQLAEINAQIAKNQTDLAAKQKERTSLERDVGVLDAQIQAAQLAIKQRDLTIKELNADIADLRAGISHLDSKVVAGQQSLAEIMRQTHVIDDTSMVELVLRGNITDAFQDIDDFQSIQRAMGQAFTEMAATRSDLSAREDTLHDKQQEENNLLQLQVLQKQALQEKEQQKQDLVNAAKGQESLYQKVIATQQLTANQIKQQLFSLNNANHSTSFGDMYGYAREASAVTGVEPAFILAILTEESSLGKNVGNCTYEDAMSPKRDIPVYLQLMQELGLDPDSEKVSCAQSYGAYGGAMGPAQFIPSTWALYKDRIGRASGQNPPNPWDPRTATFATAIYMSDLGADAGTAASEREAALRYLAGSHWQNPAYAFYWESVAGYMQQYQDNIAVLNGS